MILINNHIELEVPGNIPGYGLLIYSHFGRNSKRLHVLCKRIPSLVIKLKGKDNLLGLRGLVIHPQKPIHTCGFP